MGLKYCRSCGHARSGQMQCEICNGKSFATLDSIIESLMSLVRKQSQEIESLRAQSDHMSNHAIGNFLGQ